MDVDEDYPIEFQCPITLDIMKEPYVMPDGHTYEKEAIKLALEINHCSPLSKQHMEFSQGTINYSLKSLITSYLEKKNGIMVKKVKKQTEGVNKKENIEFDTLLAKYLSKKVNPFNDFIHVMLKPKPLDIPTPICLFCIVDVSNSMTSNSCENVSDMEDLNFSRLSLVKHSLKTICSTLRSHDRISIITFSSNAKIVINPICINSQYQKNNVFKMIDNIEEENATNIWAGLKLAFDESQKLSSEKYHKTLMLFTDGESNIDPPQGILPTLKEYLKEYKDTFTLSTFSYGNEADSHLLVDIAKLGNGVFGYCPDCTMVGTIFINFMANILSIISPIAKIKVCSKLSRKKEKPLKTYTIGPLYWGVTRNLLIKIDPSELDSIFIKIDIPDTQQEFDVEISKDIPDIQGYIDKMIQAEKANEDDNDRNRNDDNDDDDDDMVDEEEEEDEGIEEENEINEIIANNKSEKEEEKKESITTKTNDIDQTSNMNNTPIQNDSQNTKENSNINVKVDYTIINALDRSENENERYEEVVINQIYRNKFLLLLNSLTKSSSYSEVSYNKVLDFYNLLQGLNYKTKFIKDLMIDIKNDDSNHGQVEKAVREEYYKTWGRRYLDSFLRFHQFEQCGNFKDQSLQHYGKTSFKFYRKLANKKFINIPPPKVTPPKPKRSMDLNVSPKDRDRDRDSTPPPSSANMSRAARPNRSSSGIMRRFVDARGGCFNGEALVLLKDGTKKPVKDLKKGDQLSNQTIVKCLIEQNLIDQFSNSNLNASSSSPEAINKRGRGGVFMCHIQGVFFSPYHPISLDGQTWHFPIDLVQPKKVKLASWYNLILEDATNQKYEVVFDQGCRAITLGHHRCEDSVLYHPYFGSDLVIKDLKERDRFGFDHGYIYLPTIKSGILKNGYHFHCYKAKTSSSMATTTTITTTTTTYQNFTKPLMNFSFSSSSTLSSPPITLSI